MEITTVNELQDILHKVKKNIKLPQVVVVGPQSSGKSSLLESLVRRAFLPLGSGHGLKTRTPLILQLVHVDEVPDGGWGWVTFRHDTKETKFYDFDEVRNEIERETNNLLGNDKVISDEEIRLRVHSPHVINLTLVDLPGIVQVPVVGQPEDISDQLYDLVSTYISNPNCIILAVTCDPDIEDSVSLGLARKIDHNGERTLTVRTKLDLMPTSTDLHQYLSRKNIRNTTKHGIVGVKCRDHKVTKSVAEALESEREFLVSRHLASEHGTANLAKRIQKLLVDCIKQSLPQVWTEITAEQRKHQEIVQSLSDLCSVDTRKQVLLGFIGQFSEAFKDIINGTLENDEIATAAKGAKIFDEFESKLLEINPLQGLSDEYIRSNITYNTGTRPALPYSRVPFDSLAKKQIKLLAVPCTECVDLVYKKLRSIMLEILNLVTYQGYALLDFPNLKDHMILAALKLLDERLPKTKQQVRILMDNQQAYINTGHPDFVDAVDRYMVEYQSPPEITTMEKPDSSWSQWLPSLVVKRPSPPSSVVEGKKRKIFDDCTYTKYLLESYFDISRKSIDDRYSNLLQHAEDYHALSGQLHNLHGKLTSELHEANKIEELMQESEEISRKRQESLEMSQLMEKALQVLKKIH